MNGWERNAAFYHLYPLGCLGAPARNPFDGRAADRLRALHDWLDYFRDLGTDALLLGPVFQSLAHGYDVADYFRVDERLGSDDALADFSRDLHRSGMRLVLDAVFHHTGRDFPAFRDIQRNGEASVYREWYHLDFSRRSPAGDPFHYQGWAGHYDLVKLNLHNPAVRNHLFAAVAWWIDRFDVDGLRLDSADRLDPEFRRDLASHCRTLKPDFWLCGEVVHGDYRQWVNSSALGSVTNYEIYKGLWSSHNDRNYFELAHSLERQSGPLGIYRGIDLATFADNHDVDRVASTLSWSGHLYTLYMLLITMPGIPFLYYGSEWGATGQRSASSDMELRPALSPATMQDQAPHPHLHGVIKRLLAIRRHHGALRGGQYAALHIDHEQFAFLRGEGHGAIVVAVNASGADAQISIELPGIVAGQLRDLLNEGDVFPIRAARCVLPLQPSWGRILVTEE